MKGIILAGGNGTRLYPITKGVSKQLLPIYDKPMIYYPMSVLMLAEIRDILIITTKQDATSFKRLLGNGENFGINLKYAIQTCPNGLAEAFIIGKDFIGEDSVCLILGDNIFYGHGFVSELKNTIKKVEIQDKANIFGYWVKDPQRYGVAKFNKDGKILAIEEKPNNPKSNYAIVGLYFFPNRVIKYANKIKPSKRGELEITDLNNLFIKENKLNITLLGRGFAWLDCGTHESLSEASTFIEVLEKRQGLKIACLEEIAYNNKWISKKRLLEIAKPMKNNQYGQHLIDVAK